MLQGWVQTWYSDCQEQLEALNKQIYKVWQQEESECQQLNADSPGKVSLAQTDVKRLLESKEQLLTQAEGKLSILSIYCVTVAFQNWLLLHCISGCESWK
jgi:flagellar biosynthesis chaperone FliJ